MFFPLTTNPKMVHKYKKSILPMNPPALWATTSNENMVLLIANNLRGHFRGNPKTFKFNFEHPGRASLKQTFIHKAKADVCVKKPTLIPAFSPRRRRNGCRVFGNTRGWIGRRVIHDLTRVPAESPLPGGEDLGEGGRP
jgi:hypothetical protein